ncbi:subclass B3 metallo-beta-lactamase [Sphingoaurantiacus capsulatus]|uniref:Subclass B3 metallo-beta-lactamase n=1 Tax=Sphingoaurantiacus capsulatus TaxID=1771310 RepID=A0ABV7XEB2_9SPHN
MKRIGAALALTMLAAAAPADDPLLRPIAPDFAKQWLTPQPPVKVFGNTYLVGFGGMNVALIKTKTGLILIDGALPQAVPAIEDNIVKLGFRLKDVELILSTEPHYDHAGGLAALTRDTGGLVVASKPAGAVLKRGRNGPDDPQMADLLPFPPVERLRMVRDGEKVRLGDVIVTAVATPGHTAGSMSWTWKSCEGERCVDMVFGASLNPVSAEGYRFSDPANAAVVTAFRYSFARLRELPCDMLISAHPVHSGGVEKMARLIEGASPNPFLDPGACSAYADKYARLLDERLAREAR